MKRMIAIVLIILISIFSLLSVVARQNIYVEVFQPDYTVMVGRKMLNNNTIYPILEYNGTTYISLHDYAKLWSGSVRWDEERQVPFLSVKGYHPYYRGSKFLFDDITSSEEIGKALAREKFGSLITEKTKYSIIEIGLSGAFAYYSIYIHLDGSDVTAEQLDDMGYCTKNADLEIRYWVKSGEIWFLERKNDDWNRLFMGQDCDNINHNTWLVADRRFLGTAEKFQSVVGLNQETLFITSYPILNYQDRTYVSLRDVANTFQYHVYWDEEKRVASADRKQYARPAIEKPETALSIAKASVKWRYPNNVTEDTKYILHQVAEDDGITTTYWVYVFFDAKDIGREDQKYADVAVAVDSVVGFVGLNEKGQGDGSLFFCP